MRATKPPGADAGRPMLICNPLDLSYRMQNVVSQGRHAVFREAADPSLVRFGGRYLLFASMSGGFWHSADLRAWTFQAMPELPVNDYAPDAAVIDGALVVCASRRRRSCDFFRTGDPVGGTWERIPGALSFWDPALFQDDDGRVYLYEGCSARAPIRGVELDRRTLRPIGPTHDLIRADPGRHGWERPAEDWDPHKQSRNLVLRLLFGTRPFIEGAWMTKYDGRYYLQYAAPGTELNSYADGYYTAPSPLGPFEYAPSSPFSSHPGGFITGAGHGSTVQDDHGNWWHAATMRISRQHGMERRIGIFPAGFDAEGNLFCNQQFADYPIVVPDGPADPWSLTGSLMLLSAQATASSSAPGHPPQSAIDEDVRSWWRAGSAAADEWLQVALPDYCAVSAIQINTYEDAAPQPRPLPGQGTKNLLGHRVTTSTDVASPFLLEASEDGVHWRVLRDGRSDGRPHELVHVDPPAPIRHLRVTAGRHPLGVPLTISGLRVFGHREGAPPAGAEITRARRTDPLTVDLGWTPIAGATGYSVRYGLRPDKLYVAWQTTATRLRLGSLGHDLDYWIAVDAFNESGITPGAPLLVASPNHR